jgi:hypothetical protein
MLSFALNYMHCIICNIFHAEQILFMVLGRVIVANLAQVQKRQAEKVWLLKTMGVFMWAVSL